MTTKYELKEVRIDQIKPSEDNPRKTFNQERLKELAESIKSIDLMEEIVVRPSDNSHYEIINGERRWRAERELIGNEGLLKVRVYDVDRVTAQEMRLTELSQREDVDQIEVENAVYKYWLLKGKPQYSKIAIKIGYSEPWISAAVNAGKDRFPTFYYRVATLERTGYLRTERVWRERRCHLEKKGAEIAGDAIK